MKKYQILEHKGDLKIKVFGKNLKELFENALIGMFESAQYKKEAGNQKSRAKIRIKSIDLSSLLVNFLSEALYLSEIHRVIYNQVQFKKFNRKTLEGILIGEKLKRIGMVIKGVTYHNLEIYQKTNKNWEAIILFDI